VNISNRFTEYGMTGAFFWLSQLLFFVLGYSDSFDEAWNTVKDYLQHHAAGPEVLKDSLGALITTFGVISIFVAGLLLDLLGSHVFLGEMIVFNRHLHRNKSWLDRMTVQCTGDIARDYRELRDGFGDNFIASPKQALARFGMRRQCRRLQAYLLSFIHVCSGASLSESLVDSMHLWRTARSVSTTMVILFFEGLFVELTSLGLSALVAIFILSAYITLSAYNRMCITLFSLACAVFSKAGAVMPLNDVLEKEVTA
jgi:hypothetical protein